MINNINWKRLRRIALALFLLVICALVFTSNHFFYLSHQIFPILTKLQSNHSAETDTSGNSPFIIAHRGWGRFSTSPNAHSENHLIGNTRKSIEAAIATKADWIEIDIRVSQDKQLLVFHDAEIDAKTSGTGKVEEMTLVELQSFDILVDPPEQIPSLKDVFHEFHKGKQHWVLDVKVTGISDEVISYLQEAHIPQDQVILFGDHAVLNEYKGKGYRLGYTTLFGSLLHMVYSHSEVFKRCQDNSYSILVAPIFFVTPNLVAGAEEIGIEVWSYDSNDPQDLEYSAKCGVKGLIVDNPEAAISQFGHPNNHNPITYEATTHP